MQIVTAQIRRYDIDCQDKIINGYQKEWRVVAITIVLDIRERRQVVFRIMDVMKIDVISKKYPAQSSMAKTIVHHGLGERHQQMGSYSRQKK
jgi:hypothetical protein